MKVKPIFIVGVPRCGSTLVEKIIASGSQPLPMGEETGILNTLMESKLSPASFQKALMEKYQHKGLIQEKSNYTFTDKTLDNFFYIDIIKRIFPYAKVINCKRKALSSIMSTLQTNLITMAWAHSLPSIFKYYNVYRQTIKKFKKIFPNFIYDLQYEDLVNHPEREAQKLMAFCELPWDPKCLEFYKRTDLISKTGSNIQIRKAIYKDSGNQYLPYKEFLV